jgi:fatty acid desaturase
MKCPHCNHSQTLTMLAYYRAPMGRHTCSSCGGRFEFRQSLSNVLVTLLASVLTVFAPALLVFWLSQSIWIAVLCGLACCFLFYFPVGRFLEERRETKKL